MSALLINALRYILFRISEYIPWTQEMSNEAMSREPYTLEFIPDRFKTQELYNEADEANPYTLWHVPDHLRM